MSLHTHLLGVTMHVKELWRFPVKSMLGETLDEATIGPMGIDGDRRRAVIDRDTGVSLSAKRYGALLTCTARTVDGEVIIRFPDGEEAAVDSEQVADRLSELLERQVKVATAPDQRPVRHEFPTDISTGEGQPFLHEPGFAAFFDRAPLHLLTTATVEALKRLRPVSVFAVARFRPNIIVEADGARFVEDEWVGDTLRVGNAQLTVLDRKPRCVMTTRPQGVLVKDPGVLRTVAESNGGNAGVELLTEHRATIRVGDMVERIG